jgi:cupin fold WbuC family metalloprotein
MNSKLYKIDYLGRTPAIFLKSKLLKIDNKTLNFLKNYSKKLDNSNLRICMHRNKKNKLHNMIVLINKKDKHFLHKHLKKEEIYHILEGSIKIEIIKNNKKKEVILNKYKNFIFRMEKNTFHRISPLSNIAIFHEIRLGPLSKKDSIFM